MRGFRTRHTVAEVLALIDARTTTLKSEDVRLAAAPGRVLACGVVASVAVPPFDRAAMDGYAVRGEETFGADAYTPALFRLIGDARPGQRFSDQVGAGEAVRIMTGAPLPQGADCVVKVESTRIETETVFVSEPTPPGRHVGRRGEDIEAGEGVLEAGRILRPQDLGVLSALGLDKVSVVCRPVVTIVITGDELLPAGTPPRHARIPDMNSVMLAALVERDGGIAQVAGPVADDREMLRRVLAEAVAASEVVLISGGSSTGLEDHAPGLVAELGDLVVHGVAMRPASPAGLGFVGEVPVVLLPGNPVSCLCAYDFFAGRIVRRRGGRPPEWPYRPVERPLARKLVSTLGRVDYARVRIVDELVEPLAISGASILSSTTRADGFVVVPADLEGYPRGECVTVWRYDV
jgi:molybdopterin molybdotransferase